MGILNKISDKFSLATVHPEVEVLDKYLFHQVPFHVRIKLVAGNKKIKIDQLEVDLVWEETPDPGRSDMIAPSLRAMNTTAEGREKHIIFKQKTRQSIKLEPQGSFPVDLTFNTDKAVRYRNIDNFYLRVIVDSAKSPQIRDRKDIEVLPELGLSAPLITMMEKLRFQRKHLDKDHIDRSYPNQWLLNPMPGTYSHLDEVLLTVVEVENREMEIFLNMRMCEDPYGENKGISEEIQNSFLIHYDQVVDQNNKLIADLLSHNMYNLLTEADKQFYQTMVVNRGASIDI